jgi:NAD(P)-dependent dehydrogenase (short-subunit alcohol dehydrogenase family)
MNGTPTQPLAGRVAIVTGASQGLGAAIAEAYLAAGASVVLCARTAGDLDAQRQRLEGSYPAGRVVAQVADVAVTSDIDALFERTLSTFGRLDILVNNAGGYGPMGPIETVDWDAWVKAIAINLTGNVYCARKAVPIFKAQRAGKIIFLSGGGATNPLPGISAYAASKAAIVRMVETLALELREWSIDVNAVAPGTLMTRLTDELLAAGPTRVSPALYERMVKLKAEGGTPLDIPAQCCVYLASAASDGLTGRLIAAVWDPWPFGPGALADIRDSDIYTLRRIVPKERGKAWGDRE